MYKPHNHTLTALALATPASVDYQPIANPPYNRGRGSVDGASIRLHAQY